MWCAVRLAVWLLAVRLWFGLPVLPALPAGTRVAGLGQHVLLVRLGGEGGLMR